MLKPFLVAGFILLAGCSQPGSPRIPAQPFDAPPQITGCVGTFSAVTMPEQVLNAPYPSAWQDSPSGLVSILLELLKCAHMSWGPLERSNVGFVFELTDRGYVPDSCRYDHPDFMDVLLKIIVDDPDLAKLMQARYAGIPVYYGHVEVQLSSVQSFDFMDWSWNVGGGANSTLRGGDGHDTPNVDAESERFFWPNGDGLGVLQLDRVFSGGIQILAHTGTMQPPMFYAGASPTQDYLGYGSATLDFNSTASVKMFGDQQCTSPSPP